MTKYLNNRVKPYYLKRAKEGVLLIHGFSGSPAKLHFLEEYLRKHTDFSLSVPLLSGHGTNPDEMKKVSYKDWINDVMTAYGRLKKDCVKINVIGFSMGGLLALILAAQKRVERLVTIAPAIILKDKLATLALIGKYFLHYHSAANFNETFPDEASQYALDYNLGYDKYLVKSVGDLLKLEKAAKADLSNVRCPLLIIQSLNDEIVDPLGAKFIYDNIGSEKKKIVWLDTSRHICTLGPEKEILHKHVLEFFKRDFK